MKCLEANVNGIQMKRTKHILHTVLRISEQ